MSESERKKIHYEFKRNKDKTVLHGKTTLALLKKIIDPTNGKTFDWAFVTNPDEIELDYIIPTYKGRWRIETGFRVQDEARIKELHWERGNPLRNRPKLNNLLHVLKAHSPKRKRRRSALFAGFLSHGLYGLPSYPFSPSLFPIFNYLLSFSILRIYLHLFHPSLFKVILKI
jgi:hypothetical protein